MRTRSPASAATSYHDAIVKYLNLYYSGRDKLPPDETNGNTPLVSAHEVAWYAWTATKDPRMGEFISKGEVKNMIDLCYQTLALAEIDRAKYAGPDREECRAHPLAAASRRPVVRALRAEPAGGRISDRPRAVGPAGGRHSRRQPAGRQGDRLPAEAPAGLRRLDGSAAVVREFPHAVPRDPDGDPRAQLLLPGAARQGLELRRSSNASPPTRSRCSNNSTRCGIAPSAEVRKQIEAATQSNDALIRQAAVEALGRLGAESKLLGDPSKLVQRTAAWATRQAYSRHPDTPSADLTGCAGLRRRPHPMGRHARLRRALRRAGQAARDGRRARETDRRSRRADPHAGRERTLAVLVLGARRAHQVRDRGHHPGRHRQSHSRPGCRANLREAIYNLADENIRYLYNNWVPLLGQQEDRDRAIRGRLAVESRLAAKFAAVLERGPESQKKELLRSLTELPLRRGDIYDLEADLGKTAPPVYNRIGNDIEQIAFFGPERRPLRGGPDAAARFIRPRDAPAGRGGLSAGP